MINIPMWHLLLWPECFRRDLAIIYRCIKPETEQPGRWPAEESFLKAGLFPTDGAGPASHRRFHFYHPHLTGLKTTMQPLFIFFLSVEASGRISLSHGYSFMYERSEQHFHSLVLPGVLKQDCKPAEFSAFKNTVWNLVGRTSSSILLTLQSPMATKLIWYKIMKNNEIITTTWRE